MIAVFFVGLFTFLWTGAYMSLAGMDKPCPPKGGKRSKTLVYALLSNTD